MIYTLSDLQSNNIAENTNIYFLCFIENNERVMGKK